VNVQDETWLSTDDLAARYQRSPVSIRQWRHNGTGPRGTRFGKKVLYRLSDVEAWERGKEEAEHGSEDRVSA
jgi:Helix-turn-helix domain